MHLLTVIRDTASTTVTAVPYEDFDEAHRALMSHVIADDLYLHADWPIPVNVAKFTLVNVDDRDELTRRPRVVGTATIAPFIGGAIESAPYCARNAQRWITDHEATWYQGSERDCGARFPLALMHAAQAEARNLFTAGTCYAQAAQLAGVSHDEARPHQRTFDRLRHVAISLARTKPNLSADELATEVSSHLGADITEHQTAGLIWWVALLIWGVHAP